jgi:hypothetical protein
MRKVILTSDIFAHFSFVLQAVPSGDVPVHNLPLVQVLHSLKHLQPEADNDVGGETCLPVGQQPLLEISVSRVGVD